MQMHVTFDSLKTFYNIFLQKLKNYRGNWDQNDPTADDYIKNRPFYTENKKKVILDNYTYENYCSGTEIPKCNFIQNNKYSVIYNGTLFEDIVCHLFGEYSGLGGFDSGYPFYIDDDGGNSFYIEAKDENWCVSIYTYSEVIHQIDKRYVPIPDGIMTENDVSDIVGEAVNYLEGEISNNTSYTKNYFEERLSNETSSVVRFISQSLTDSEKATARNNIGAFDGDYNKLTNKIVNYGDFSDYRSYGITLPELNGIYTTHDASREIYKIDIYGTSFTTLMQCEGIVKFTIANDVWYCKKSSIKIADGNVSHQTAGCFGNKYLFSDIEENTGEPFFILLSNAERGVYYAEADAGKEIVFYTSKSGSFKQLDEILIPDTIARVSEVEKVHTLVGDTPVSDQITDAIEEAIVEVYVQDNIPEDAPDGSIWVNLDADGAPTTSGKTTAKVYVVDAGTTDMTTIDFSQYAIGDVVVVTSS